MARKWWQKASEQGNANAQTRLGFMYAYGIYGVKKDVSKAKQYFGMACDNKEQLGCDMYKKFYRK